MHRDQGIVQETESEKAYSHNIQHKTLVCLQRDIFLGIRLEKLRIGEVAPRDNQQRQSYDSRDSEGKETEAVALESTAFSLEKHYHIEKQRTQNRTELIQKFLQAECLAGSLL